MDYIDLIMVDGGKVSIRQRNSLKEAWDIGLRCLIEGGKGGVLEVKIYF